MYTIQVRSQVEADGSVRVQLPASFANQEVDLVLSYQPLEEIALPDPNTDPLIGLFAGSPDLAANAEAILEREINPTSGWSWKLQSPTQDS
jgi:hypothetical protein